MTSIEPGEGTSEPAAQKGGEPQQQLAHELEEIAAKQLEQPDDKTAILFDPNHPENQTNKTEADRVKLNFERDISELRQRVMNAMVDFSQRIALINGEARGEEHLAIDVQFTKTIQAIREKVIDRVPELADQCWQVSNKAREDELASMQKLDRVVDDTRKVVVDAGGKAAEQLGGLKDAVVDEARGREVEGQALSAERSLVDSYKYVEGELAKIPRFLSAERSLVDGIVYVEGKLATIPRFYGEVEAQLEKLIEAYKELLSAADRPLSDSEQDEFNRFFHERSDVFIAQLKAKVKLERERVNNIADAMHDYYSGDYRPTVDRALGGLGGEPKPH